MGFALYDFPLAAPGATIVQVIFPEGMSSQKEAWLRSKLDEYYKTCRTSDLFHLSFLGAIYGLQLAGLVASYTDKVAVPRSTFTGYRCAYGGSTGSPAPAPMVEQPETEKVKPAGKTTDPDPSPLDALLQPGAWDMTGKRVAEEGQQLPAPREPLQTPEERVAMQHRLDHMREDLPDGMVAE